MESDPSAAILAGLGKNSTRRNHMRALHHSNVGAAIKSVERSLGNHRRLQNPYSDSNKKRRSPKRHMGRDRPHHGHMGDSWRPDQNGSPASGAPKQAGTTHHRRCCRPHGRNGFGIPITHRKAAIQLNDLQTGSGKRNRCRFHTGCDHPSVTGVEPREYLAR